MEPIRQIRPRPPRLLRLLAPALGVFLAATAAAPGSADAAPVPARTAASFVDSIGVATHFSFNDTPYVERFQEVKAKLLELGVHHVREDLLPGRPDQYARINELAAAGIGDTLIMGWPRDGTAILENLLAVVRDKLNGVDALEGPNEPYLNGGSNWVAITVAYQRLLHEIASTTPQLAALPIVGPTTVFSQNGELGDISPLLSYGDIHPYPGGYPPEENLKRHVDFAALSSGTKPLMATETGYHNAMGWTGGHPPTSEAATAVYIPRIFLDYFQEGIARAFDYELVDEFPDPNGTEREAHFGLLRHDLSPKPAYIALKNLISIVGDGDDSFSPGALSYTVGGNTEKLHQVLLQKADGSFYLALWRASSVWDPERQVPLAAPTSPVKLQFGQTIVSATEYMPNKSSEPLAQLPTGGSLQVNVGPEVVILKLDANGDSGAAQPVGAESVRATDSQAVGPGPAPAPSGSRASTPPGPSRSSSGSGQGVGSTTASHHPADHRRRPVRVKAWVKKRRGSGRARVVVRGRVAGTARRATVAIESWRHGWRTVRRARTSRSGSFGTQVALHPAPGRATARVRVSSPAASPSAPIAVRVG